MCMFYALICLFVNFPLIRYCSTNDMEFSLSSPFVHPKPWIHSESIFTASDSFKVKWLRHFINVVLSYLLKQSTPEALWDGRKHLGSEFHRPRCWNDDTKTTEKAPRSWLKIELENDAPDCKRWKYRTLECRTRNKFPYQTLYYSVCTSSQNIYDLSKISFLSDCL